MANLYSSRARLHRLSKVANQQAWLVLATIAGGLVYDILMGNSGWLVTKNIAAGSSLAWLGNLLFTKLALRTTGASHRRQIVNNFYLAQGIKWLIVMLGFAVIFAKLRPLLPLWVFGGFVGLQLTHLYLSHRESRIK